MQDIDHLLSQLTLDEKASLCSGRNFWYLRGIERLDIPSIMVTDGPHGLRKQAGDSDHVGLNDSVPATCFPTASALAATWDPELLYEVGEALGEECCAENVAVLLGPGINIKRSPLCGRNFEYFSEDPYLSGELAKRYIHGVQSKGVGTSVKHYSVNNQESRRMTIDAVVDERALHEIYLPGYEVAVKEAQPWTMMCAYNRVNGTYAAENPHLMTTILKEQWGHTGLVVTDWGAMNDPVAGVAAGVELEMPGTNNGNQARIVAAVQSGELAEAALDKAVRRILELIAKAQPMLAEETTFDAEVHHAFARRVAGEAVVLLKNEGATLPLSLENLSLENLSVDKKIALLGRFAKHPRYQGAGSSLVQPTRLDNLYDEMVALIGADNVSYAAGYDEHGEQINQQLIDEALAVADSVETVVVCVGLTDRYEVEGVDRTHMDLPPAHNALVHALAATAANVVVVLSNGSPVAMPWADDVAAIVEGHLGGQAGAGGVADVLLGKVNPSGKLAETFPLRLADNPSYPHFPGGPMTVEYRESIYIGYRYYDTVEQPVLFPFGHGLSYTEFEYSNLQLSKSEAAESEPLQVSLTVKNVGNMAGKEVVQLYVRDPEASVFRPNKELKRFAKVMLEPNEETTVAFELDRRSFAYYSPAAKDWVVESGQFEVLVGASVADIRLQDTVQINAAQPAPAEQNIPAVYFNYPKNDTVSQQDFEALLGHLAPPNVANAKGHFTINTPMSDLQSSFIGRQLHNLMQRQARQLIGEDEGSPNAQMIQSMLKDAPLRVLLMLGNGAVTRDTLEGVVQVLNGRYIQGIGAIIKSLRK